MLLGVLPLFFFQTAVHEGAHCVMLAATGLGCRLCAPFPVALGFGLLHGVTFAVDESAAPGVPMVIAPQVLAALLIVTLRLIAPQVRDERWALLTRLWLLGACVDLFNNTLWNPHGQFGDWSVMASQLGLSPGERFAVSVPLWLTVLGGLFVPLPASFPRPSASVRDFWEIGVVYALVSALAIVVSTTVEVPDSDPASPWHRVPILLQAGSVVVCLAMVATARLGAREVA